METNLRAVAERLQTDAQFVSAVVADPGTALADYGLTAAQQAAVASFVAQYQQYGLAGLDSVQSARWWSPEEPLDKQYARWWSPEEPMNKQYARWWSPEELVP